MPARATPPDPTEERLLNAEEFAAMLGLCKRKAFEIWSNGSIPVVVLGRRCRRVRLAESPYTRSASGGHQGRSQWRQKAAGAEPCGDAR